MSDSAPVEATAARSPVVRALRGGEELVANLALAAMVLLPLAEIVVRPVLTGGIPGSIPFVQHLTLCVGFLGAALAAREGKLIALATESCIPAGSMRKAARIFAAADQPGFHGDYLRKRCLELTGRAPPGRAHLTIVD